MPYNRYDGWEVELGDSPVIGPAIHSGSELRQDCRNLARLSDSERLREEDPFTDMLIEDFPNRIVVHRSRFEVDLNRAREAAVYVRPEQAWGLNAGQARPTRHTSRRHWDFMTISMPDSKPFWPISRAVSAGLCSSMCTATTTGAPDQGCPDSTGGSAGH